MLSCQNEKINRLYYGSKKIKTAYWGSKKIFEARNINDSYRLLLLDYKLYFLKKYPTNSEPTQIMERIPFDKPFLGLHAGDYFSFCLCPDGIYAMDQHKYGEDSDVEFEKIVSGSWDEILIGKYLKKDHRIYGFSEYKDLEGNYIFEPPVLIDSNVKNFFNGDYTKNGYLYHVTNSESYADDTMIKWDWVIKCSSTTGTLMYLGSINGVLNLYFLAVYDGRRGVGRHSWSSSDDRDYSRMKKIQIASAGIVCGVIDDLLIKILIENGQCKTTVLRRGNITALAYPFAIVDEIPVKLSDSDYSYPGDVKGFWDCVRGAHGYYWRYKNDRLFLCDTKRMSEIILEE